MTENTMKNLTQRNMDLVRAWVDAINRNDIEAELDCWQPDGEFFVTPTGTTYRGVAEIRRAGEKSASVIGGQPIQGRKQITHLDAGEDWAVVEYDTRADIQGPINLGNVTILPEGGTRTVVTRACVVFQMKQGKFQRAQEFFDTLSLPQQLGIDRATLEKMYASLAAKADFCQ
jgi:ketosteroid isomerase-like protein